jgi:hypothetical protein
VDVCQAGLDNPAVTAEPGTVCLAAVCDRWRDPERPEQPPVLLVGISSIGESLVGLSAWSTALAGDRPLVQDFEQWQKLRDGVAVSVGQRRCERATVFPAT